MKDSLLKRLEGYFKKEKDSSKGYEKALEKHQEELIKLQAELKEKELKLKEFHKMYLLSQITEETYKQEKEVVDTLKTKIADVQQDMKLIETYKDEDARQIVADFEANHGEYGREKQKEITKLQYELLEAKDAYLSKLVEASEQYDKLINPERKLQQLKVKLGIQKATYVSGSHDALNLISLGDGYESLRIEQPEIFDALQYGRKPSKLEKAVKDAKEKGTI
ncbi:hypothetical protein [Niallia circulans]|uniref:Uncharacterized protein n=1 Tax=Niallia circulans TaxID=1397 RepID=A0A941G9N2_NIACI|nr:hypothetical protein [Niallia circulans]MCB5235898.1 hypothetical protein [Niallia circulans]